MERGRRKCWLQWILSYLLEKTKHRTICRWMVCSASSWIRYHFTPIQVKQIACFLNCALTFSCSRWPPDVTHHLQIPPHKLVELMGFPPSWGKKINESHPLISSSLLTIGKFTANSYEWGVHPINFCHGQKSMRHRLVSSRLWVTAPRAVIRASLEASLNWLRSHGFR